MVKSCRNCVYEIWAIGIGQGVTCDCPENQGKDLGWGLRSRPLLPASTTHLCEHYQREKCDD